MCSGTTKLFVELAQKRSVLCIFWSIWQNFRSGFCKQGTKRYKQKRRCDTLTATAVKASAGAASFTPVARVSNIAQTIDFLKEEGVWITGADAKGDRSIYEADFKGAVALVIGGEDKGISRLTASKCDFLVGIPMKGNVNSLNASVAGALMIYEAMKQR